MKANINKRVSLVLCVLLAITLLAGAGYAATNGVAYAAINPTDSLTIVQMSDIHYFPLKYCYQDVTDPDYKTSDFYHSTTGDTKLVLESGVILNGAVKDIIQKAKDGTAPMYFLATGDLCKNGEREALIDVANALRYMQNQIRSTVPGYENFQVLAQVGNHDLYNTDAALYSQEDGSELIADTVTAAQFAMIFAGLGFPNASIDGRNGTLNLTDYLPAEYWSSEYVSEYQYSENASNLKINYYAQELNDAVAATSSAEKLQNYFKLGDGLNKLSYTVEITGNDEDYGFIMFDSTDREATDEGKPVRVSREEYNYLKDVKQESQVYFEGVDDTIDFEHPITNAQTVEDLFAAGKPVYRAAKYAHITGGRLTENVIDWAENFANTQHAAAKENGTVQKTLIAAFHHNLLPHFDVEDDILKDFTLYNWEYAAKRFADMGVRYVFTGHQHSSDIAAYTDVEGRTVYDSETGSMVSYESPRRYVTLNRYVEGNDLKEQMTSSIHATGDMKEIASIHIDQDTEWNEDAYQTALASYNLDPTPEKWQDVIATNPNYVAYIVEHERLKTRNYNEYIGEEIYTCLVDRVLAHFVSGDTVDSLLDTVDNMIANLDLGFVGGLVTTMTGFTFGEDGSLRGFVNYLLDLVVNNLYPDGKYPYDGENYDGILDYLLAIVNNLVDMEFGDPNITSVNPHNAGKMSLKEMAGFIMMAHATGTEVKLVTTDAELQAEYDYINANFPAEVKVPEGEDFRFKNPLNRTYRMRMTAALKDAHEQLISGKFAGDLLDALLNPLYKNDDALLRRLLTIKIDINDAVPKYMSQEDADFIANSMKDEFPEMFREVVPLLNQDITVDENYVAPSIDMHNLTVEGLVNSLLPAIKPIVANLIGFNLSGDGLFEIIDNALAGYVTDSFLVGLGGIADEIVVAYATDAFPDLADMCDASQPFIVQPYAGYTQNMTYDSTKVTPSAVGAQFNPATQDNGRVPSRLTANFDTADSTGSYTFKFYTDEEIYARFKYKTEKDGEWTYVATSAANVTAGSKYLDSRASDTTNGITVSMLTQTRPAYVPLIDLGLACITHGEIVNEDADGNEIPITAVKGQRDSSAKNSVIYKNVTTVTLSGLKAGTTYYYDIEGVYVTSNGTPLSFSLVQNAGEECYTFTTAADESVTDFEFLTIADIQGMIQSMYDNSHKAVEALLKDSRTNNFDFLLNAGDMVDNGKNFRQWGMALNTYEDLFANTSQFFTAGNHEDGKNAFATYFNYTLPSKDGAALQPDITDGAFYSFDYGNSHFTVLNTNDASGEGLGDIQLQWLKDDLQSAQNKKWRFVLMHKSLFSGGSHSYDGEVIAMRQQLVPLFAENNVSMVFAGHDHTYTTTKLVSKDGKVVDKPDLSGVRYTGDGVMYVTLGTMGTKFYTYGENSNVTPKFDKNNSILHTLTSQTFGKVKVGADEIVFTGYVYDPETDTLSVIGKPIALSAKKVTPASTVYAIIGVLAGVVAIAAVIIVVLVLKKKKAGAKQASANDEQQPSEEETSEETAPGKPDEE